MSSTNKEFPYNANVGDRIIPCRSIEDRRLLQEAGAIAADPTAADLMSIGRLHLIKDACQLYSLGKHQRLVKMAIDQSEH